MYILIYTKFGGVSLKILNTRRVRKVGNSKVVTLPNELLEKLNVKENDNIVFIERDGKIYIESSVQEENLEDKMKRIADNNDEVLKALVDK